ncbi:flagellar biosynthetic protein FliO [Pirellulales bacterium]|nr:flagellar biosynthetic protein FliO [Pirellulales bacterium]
MSTASHTQPETTLQTTAPRRLAPVDGQDRTEAPLGANFFSTSLPARQMLLTSGAGLAIVIGLLLACAWLVRRGSPRGNDSLPPEAFAVLGKAPLFGQTVGHLIRLGNKLVLVAATADGIQPLVEVTDCEEVDRLSGLCLAKQPHSSAAEFQQVLRSLAQEPAKGFLGRT